MAYPYTYNFDYYVGDSYQFVIRPKVYNENTEELEEVNLSEYNSLFIKYLNISFTPEPSPVSSPQKPQTFDFSTLVAQKVI